MKKCPFCAEEIQDEAIKCRYCHEFLEDSFRPPPFPGSFAGRFNPQPWYFRSGFLVVLFLSLPPAVLPLVWLRPKTPVVVKLLTTIAVVGFCAVVWYALSGFVSQFDEATKMLNDRAI